ncbi:STAS domain-containing protein [Nonomuraea sp. NPDC049152]|uniref:STAS domain-containing protein n=1 Tax=Nonomuraea sp. NPDC049152 TaxID=3154350 RepID=UPI0033C2A98F
MSDTLKLITTPDAGTLILQPSGELTWQTATALRAWFEEYASDPAPLTVIDLSALNFLDSTGLAALIAIYTRLSDAGARLAYRRRTTGRCRGRSSWATGKDRPSAAALQRACGVGEFADLAKHAHMRPARWPCAFGVCALPTRVRAIAGPGRVTCTSRTWRCWHSRPVPRRIFGDLLGTGTRSICPAGTRGNRASQPQTRQGSTRVSGSGRSRWDARAAAPNRSALLAEEIAVALRAASVVVEHRDLDKLVVERQPR